MNCKPGDLAVLIRSEWAPQCVGQITRCVERRDYYGAPGWTVDPPFRHALRDVDPAWTLDSSLKPIRDPGDDAQDETLNWLPVPTKEIA